MKARPLPDQSRFAFIVGAPRCGTTTLASFLKQHPEICFSRVKEPHFFAMHDMAGMDDAELKAFVDEEYWSRFFDRCTPGSMPAEGSVTYLYAAERMEPILRLWPDAKFIIALRDPLAMLPSLHARLLVNGDEAISDFNKAWDKVEDRALGRSIPRSAIDARFLRYDEAGKLGSHVEKFFEAVGRERCHVVLFDDLVADPEATYRGICSFLGLEPWPQTKFRQRRQHKDIRFGWLQRLLKRPPKPVRSVMAGKKYRQRVKPLDAKESRAIDAIFRVRKRLLAWNKVPAKRRPLDDRVRQEIIDRLRGEIILLSRVIDRDLSHWLGGVPEADPPRKEARRA